MFDPATGPRVFALPPGAGFPRALVAGLRARMEGRPPEAMARVTVFLNTAKMLDRVRAAFQGAGPGFLPRLRPLADIGIDPVGNLPPPVPPLRRRLDLTRLVAELVARQPDFASGTAVYDLADSLARLMDEMQGEGVAPARLNEPGLADDHAAHWERSLTFLRIIGHYLGEGAAPDPEARQRLVIEAMAASWQPAPPQDPVIVAGSTGSRGSTAMLMEAVARLPQGALVLPGFDFDMPEMAWNGLSSSQIPNEDHPQYRYARLLGALGLRPDEVRRWGEVPVDSARNRLVSLALRPAPVTDQWLTEGAGLLPLGPPTERLTLIEAPTAQAEAQAVALVLRAAAKGGQRATLVTPDRVLARRVTAALDRWGIIPDDSAGRPLHLSAPGRFLRHVAALFGRPVTAEALLTVLKHPLTAARARGAHLGFTRALELRLRRHGPPFPAEADLLAWAATQTDPDCMTWATWLGRWLSGLPTAEYAPLAGYSETVFALAEALAAGPGGQRDQMALWADDAGQAALAVVAELRAEAASGGDFTAGAFCALLDSLLQGQTVRETGAAHALIAIQGIRESRQIEADLVVLAGLNEGIWPEATGPDPWLSRQMRLKIGLLLPERQIGLAAHDFQQAIAAPSVVLARAIRDDEAQTVPSRWLDRLTNLMAGLEGEGGALSAMRARGQVWVDLAGRLDRGPATPPALRPAPRPPADARPRELPVTAIRDLIRDPYAVYARYVLRLRPLDPLLPEPDPRLRGKALHRIVEEFVGAHPRAETLGDARARLLEAAEQILQAEIGWPSAQRLWLARIARIADRFVAAEAARAATGRPLILERGGRIALDRLDFTLTARPDRIDLLEDGRLHVYDYKSGQPPTPKQQKYFEKQLPLEAAMAERGAFAAAGTRQVSATTYIQLGGDGEEHTTGRDVGDFNGHWDGLLRLIGHYLLQTAGFPSRRAVFEAARDGDYDHLARFGEWQMADAPAPEDVG